MSQVKKSFNMETELSDKVDEFIEKNPGVSATLVFNHAIKQWLKKPVIELNRTPATDTDVDSFLNENSDLMDDLAK